MKELNNYIITNFNNIDINHAYSIILRTHYEIENMNKKENNFSFVLNQMDNFFVEYNGSIIIKINNKLFKLTEKQLNKYVEKIYEYFNKEYNIGYDYKKIDPIYFSLFFYELLEKILYIKEDIINIDDIRLLRYKSNPVKLEESERYKALVNKDYNMYSPFKSNLMIETPEERLMNIYESIKNNGYGLNGKYAIFYNNEPYIRDGQHRVSVLKYLYGNIEIKIIRIYLKDNYFYE